MRFATFKMCVRNTEAKTFPESSFRGGGGGVGWVWRVTNTARTSVNIVMALVCFATAQWKLPFSLNPVSCPVVGCCSCAEPIQQFICVIQQLSAVVHHTFPLLVRKVRVGELPRPVSHPLVLQCAAQQLRGLRAQNFFKGLNVCS